MRWWNYWKEGLVEKIIDVQDFDHLSAISLGENNQHYEIDASMYASPATKGAMVKSARYSHFVCAEKSIRLTMSMS